MPYKIEVRPLAALEIIEADDWYELQSEGLGLSFLEELESFYNSLLGNPANYSTGSIGYLFNLFVTNRDKKRQKRYEIFQDKKLEAYVSLNTSFIEMTFLIFTAVNMSDLEEFKKNIAGLWIPSSDFLKELLSMRSYLSSDTYKKYDLIYGKITQILKDITHFGSCLTNELVFPHNDKFAMIRL